MARLGSLIGYEIWLTQQKHLRVATTRLEAATRHAMKNMVDPAPPQRRDSHESIEARFGACYERHTELAMVFKSATHCYMVLCSPKDLSTALCQACGEAPELGYFGIFGVVLTQLPTVANGRHGVGAWRAWACWLSTGPG
jgi:hypothetical protein